MFSRSARGELCGQVIRSGLKVSQERVVVLMTTEVSREALNNSPEPACPAFRLLLISCLSLGLGIATNRLLNASSGNQFTGAVQVETFLVRAPVDGILQAWHVAEGETVDPDVLLCRIGGHNLSRQLQLQRKEVARLEARHATLLAEVDVNLHDHLREIDGAIYQVELQTAELLQKKYYHEIEAMAWRDTLHTYDEGSTVLSPQDLPLLTPQDLEGGGGSKLSERQINAMLKEEAANNSIEATSAQLKLCTQRLEKLKQQKQEIARRVQMAVGVSEVELQLLQAREELQHLENSLEQQNVRSNTVGTIANFRRRPGEYVQAGEVLADMFQLSESFVIADIPTTVSHRFSVDTTVKCRFPNGETRSGVVTNVAVATSPERAGDKTTVPTVPLRIEPTGALWPNIPVGGQVTIIR